MKKILSLLTGIMLAFSVVAQSNIRLNNFWGDMHFITPATVYDKYQAVFNMAARKQWLGIDGAPMTFFASGTTYLEDYHTQLGLSLIQEEVGYTSITNLNASYAYALTLNNKWQLHMGIAANYQSVGYDISKVTLTNGSDPFAYERLLAADGLDFDLGAELSNETMKFGFATQNIVSTFIPLPNLQTNTNFLYARYHQNTQNTVNFGAGICGIQYANIYQAEVNLTGYFKFNQHNGLTEKPDLFDIGVFYRTQSEAGLILGFNITEVLHVSYSYDYHFGSLSNGSYGTNELMITYNLKRKPICHNCWYD